MALALSVFGVTSKSIPFTLCYVLMRTVRGAGDYPSPTLSGSTASGMLKRHELPGTPLNLIAWDRAYSDVDASQVLQELSKGHFIIPNDCPIAPAAAIDGLALGPLLIEETQYERAFISGMGILKRSGIATDAIFKVLNETLTANLAPGSAPKALEVLISALGRETGLAASYLKIHRLGAVDYFFREPAIGQLEGSYFNVIPDKPSLRGKDPMLRARVKRWAAPLQNSYRLQVVLRNRDELLSSELTEIGAGVSEVTITAPSHVTEMTLRVYNASGQLLDHLDGSFGQAINFELSARGIVDVLPEPFAGAPKSDDLQNRPRLHTLKFEGPAIADRSGGLDIIRKLDARLDEQIGSVAPTYESEWFERGVDGQLAVIRWIKQKMEKPGVTKTYLVDPYLGSDALRRVVARQGNATAKLFILVSPGNTNPDVETVDTPVAQGSDYLMTLRSTATDWADKLASEISIIHMERGDGARQAFHDRFLCLVDQTGVPTAYMFSNSLSKAAGAWPFAISELSRVNSWQVYSDIIEMMQGRVSGLVPEVIWSTPLVFDTPQLTVGPPSIQPEELWVTAAVALFTNIRGIIIQNSTFEPQVGALIDAFIHSWPDRTDEARFARGLYDVVKHREFIVTFTADRFRRGGKPQVAEFLEAHLFDEILAKLPEPGERSNLFIAFDKRREILKLLGATLARRPAATNFVRANFNPKLHALVERLETQRLSGLVEWDAYEAALFFSIIALQATFHMSAPDNHRVGLSTDYIHWVGRLMRSDVAGRYLAGGGEIPREVSDDVAFVAETIALVRNGLGERLDAPI